MILGVLMVLRTAGMTCIAGQTEPDTLTLENLLVKFRGFVLPNAEPGGKAYPCLRLPDNPLRLPH